MRFDTQASTFDERAGLPAPVCRRVAQQVLSVAKVKPSDVIVELGAGTGQIGRWLQPAHYVGLDVSLEMLLPFRRRLEGTTGLCSLLRADVNRPWPVAAGTARLIFSSRAAHWFDVEHVVRETWRAALPEGATFLLGRVQREAGGVPARMREEMRRLLAQRGYRGRDEAEHRRHMTGRFLELGAAPLGPLVACRWTTEASPLRSLRSWAGKKGLAGIDVPPKTKAEVLSALRDWADAALGDLETSSPSEEAYILEGVHIPPR